MRKTLWLLMVSVMTVGCSIPMKNQVQEMFPDRPPEYRDGYVDGCISGKAQAVQFGAEETKDLNRFQSNSSYANGWFDGLVSCRDSYRPPIRK